MKPKTISLISLSILVLVALLIISVKILWIDDEQAIYSALFVDVINSPGSHTAIFMSAPNNCLKLMDGTNQKLPISDELGGALKTANDLDSEVVDLKSLRHKFNIVEYKYAKLFHKTKRTLPGMNGQNIIRLSRVGFNSDGTMAIVCVSSQGESLVLLEKHQEGWQVKKWLNLSA